MDKQISACILQTLHLWRMGRPAPWGWAQEDTYQPIRQSGQRRQGGDIGWGLCLDWIEMHTGTEL